MTRRSIIAITAALALVASGCGGVAEDEPADGTTAIVTTTSIWADVVANVACGDQADVQALIPAGGDPHGFEPSLTDRARLEDADLVVVNGLGLEEGLDDTLDATEAGGTPVFVVTDHVATLTYGTDADTPDPHVWLDPKRVSDALPALADAMVTQAGLDAVTVDACVTNYQAELAAVDERTAELVADLPVERRRLVTNHDALGYFAEHYGFEVVGTVIPSPSGLAATNPAQLEDLAQAIEQAEVTTIFAESQYTADDAQALADRVGDVEVVTLNTGTLGDAGTGADTTLGLLTTNAERIVAALR